MTYTFFPYASTSANKAFKVAAVLTLATIAIGVLLVWALSVNHAYRTAPTCTGTGSAGCRMQVKATVTEVVVTNGKQSEYVLQLQVPPPTNGYVRFSNENDLVDATVIGDVVQAEIWRDQVTKVRFNGMVVNTPHLPGRRVAQALAGTLAMGGFALIFYIYGIGRRTDRFRS